MRIWDSVKRLVYRLVPILVYTDHLEEENAALRAQIETLQRYVLEMTKRAYFPNDEPRKDAPPTALEDSEVRSFVERRERDSLNRYVKSIGFADLDEYERSLVDEPQPAARSNEAH